MEDVFVSVAQQLELSSYAVVENFINKDLAIGLYNEITSLINEDELREAAIGRGVQSDVIKSIRKDEIKWINQDNDSPVVVELLSTINSMGAFLSNYFRVSIKRYEGHWAHYPPGAFYKKHVDQFQETSNRIFSIILYLNPNWQEKDGGELIIYLENEEVVKIKPTLGSLVCFRSDVLFHEVLPTQKSRYSVTGWYRNDELLPLTIA